MRSGLVGRFGAIAGHMACMLVAGLLACASSSYGQVIEEGGFPVKGGGVSGESFSLSCPPRLYARAGESVLLSCSATDVPEESVRYGWESVSGEGLRLLSDAQALAPLFAAPLSGAGEEYAYRLTAMAAGVYRTATATVSVGGVPGETVGAPVVREECDSFTVPDELGEGCVEDKGPVPFGFGSEAEGGFLFPEAPGLPDRPSGPVRGGGSVMQAPPRLECPVAIFLEELETGSIECRVFDASGEEHLEYVWEPVGGTTRDYLENPRLIPEDSPTPSVVAPEAPAYETLESFRSVETTFRYRYRLTATSRATGLSSRTEVEVFVSGSRPGVYCPPEVAVEEGETVALDCEGVDPLSSRMDYDEDGASIAWEWEGLWGASTALLDATDRSSPLFTAPAGSAGEAYHYIASMTSQASGASRTARRRVTVRVVGGEGGQASSDASALSRKGGAPVVTCEDSEIYEATADFTLACTVTDEPAGAGYRWTGTDISNRLRGADGLTPTFAAPGDISEPGEANKDYEYTVTLSANGIDVVTAAVTVTVLEKPDIYCARSTVSGAYAVTVPEGTTSFSMREFPFCRGDWAGAPDSRYMFRWTSLGGPARLSFLSATAIEYPVFHVPDMAPGYDPYFRYGYELTISAENADSYTGRVVFTVFFPVLSVSCEKTYYEVYEGSEDFPLACSASGLSSGSGYEYAWTAHSNPADMSLLSPPDVVSPVFSVPDEDELAYNTTYSYQLKVSAFRARPKTVNVRVKVLDNPNIVVTCPGNPYEVYEGSEDFELECSVSGAPEGSDYDYAWTAVRSRTNMALLSAPDVASPTFRVPEDVAALGERHEYLLKVSAQGADSGQERVRVKVLDRALAVDCMRRSYEVYEGSEDFSFDCSASGDHSGTGYQYEWTALVDTPPDLLSATDIASPTFLVPDAVEDDEEYAYRLTVSAANAEGASVDVRVRVLKRGSLSVACTDPGAVYEGSADITLDCSASGASSGSAYAYSWRARGATSGTSLLSRTDIASPVFYVPDEVDSDEIYEYLLTVSADNAESATAFVTVTVLKRGSLSVACADPGAVYEGSADVAFDCSASGVPGGSSYSYAWTARGATANTDLLSATDGPSPTFLVPDEVDSDEIYEYLLTVSADNAGSATAEVTVTVLNRRALALACADPGAVYEGSPHITLDCSASGAPSGSAYAYAWTARGGTANTDLLSATDGPSPTFLVPDEVDSDEIYEYLLTVSADNAGSATAEVTVTVLNRRALALACADPGAVYEGSPHITLDCSASGAPSGSAYAYAWTARGGTANTLQLSAPDISSPTFHVPDAVDVTTDYEYLLTVSAANAEDAAAEVTVTVLNKEALSVACMAPGSVYEGTEDIVVDCSASGAPEGSDYEYAWTGRGGTADTDLLSAADGPAPTFLVPDEVDSNETYEYLLTVSAANAEDAAAEVTVTVLNKEALSVACTDPGSVYEGTEDIVVDCSASGAPEGSDYEYAWTGRGGTADTDLLSAADGPAPTFLVPDEVDSNETYEYLLTVSAANAEDAAAEVTVTVLNKEALALACTDPGSVYEGSADFSFDCTASGAPEGSDYEYAWTARGGTADTDLLSAMDSASPTFAVPDEVEEDETYEYLLTVSAANAEDASAEVTVMVLDKEALALACADPGSVYEGSDDFSFDCTASGAPEGSDYEYAWTARGGTANTDLLSATDIASPVFYVPDAVDATTTYEYLLTVSAANAEDAAAEVAVTVLDRAVAPPSDPVSPPLASSSAREPFEPSSPGVTVSASPLRFGVQSADTQASLDPMTDGISTHVSGPYHAGRMTLSPGGSESLDENGEMALSIELASPVALRRKGGVEDASIVLLPRWSFAESCEQLSSQAIGGLYTETTLSEDACRLLRFGGELDLTDVLPGEYAGSMDVVLRSGESEETHFVEVDVTVIPAQRVITIGPGGVRFSMSRELPVGLTEEQNLSIYPDVAFLTEGKPHGAFELSNPSLIPLEISVSARFGYTEATENGREVVVEDVSESHLGDLSSVVNIRPNVLVLQPGEKGLVRYGIEEGALGAMGEKGYAAFFDVVSEPRQYVRSDRMPEEVTGDRTARVTMRVPGVYVPGEGASQLRATLLSISYVGSLSATFLVETEDHPFAGEVVAYDGDGRELGRREALVYTRSRVRIPLDRMPEEGAVFLRFMPRGSGRVPEPAAVEWDAPRRDIGGIGDKEQTPTSAAIARKP